MSKPSKLLALDVGEKRIGVAQADMSVRIAVPTTTLQVDGSEVREIYRLIVANGIDTLVVGYPRNQQGEPTKQTEYVENFVATLSESPAEIRYQDESLTSVIAKQRLEAEGRPYQKEDVDALAACLILEDFMEHQR